MEELGKKLNSSARLWLEPLADIHLSRTSLKYDQPPGNIYHVYGFAAIALFILVVACINYMNLATARSVKRAREIGMKKILGAGRSQLICQFMGEAIVFSIIAFLISLVLVKASFDLGPVNELLGKQELMDLTKNPELLLWIFGLSLLTGIISGIYPAFYLSSIRPISALTTTSHSGKKGFHLRQFLVLVQFIISTGVISCTILMAVQMDYVAKKPLGFDKENKLVINLQGADLIEKVPVIKNELEKNSKILSLTTTRVMLGQKLGISLIKIEDNDKLMSEQLINLMLISKDFLNVMGIPIVNGRDFSKRLLTDVGISLVVNETLVNRMGWTQPLGKKVGAAGGGVVARVIGVAKDFHFDSLRRQVEPLVMAALDDDFSNLPPAQRAAQARKLVVHISEEEVSDTLDFLREKFVEFDPKHPFEGEFLDDILDKVYMSDRKIMQLTGIFSGICILISCLGLFGLASFATQRRTKEIGIRKVIGASTSQIIFMLSASIIWIVLVAAVIASAASYYAIIIKWLANFAYTIDIYPLVFLVFLLSALIAIAVAFATIAAQSYKTARTNPVKSLRYE
jgi:putative ABC transport system permease protein